MVEELERTAQSLTVALAQVRTAIQMLAVAAPPSVANSLSVVLSVPEPQAEAGVTEIEDHREDVRRAVEQARKDLSWAMPVDAGFSHGKEPWHEPSVADGPADEDAERREAVRRAVEEARASMFAGDLGVPEDEGVAEASLHGIEAEPVEAKTEVENVPQEETFELLTQAPFEREAASAEGPATVHWQDVASEEPTVPAPAAELDEDARREEVRRAVEAARAEMFKSEEPASSPEGDDEARREAVRRAVEETKSHMNWGEMKVDAGGSWGQFKPEPGGFTIRPDQLAPVAGPKEEASGELVSQESEAAAPEEDEDARREAVRRAVEAARAEMFAEDKPKIVPIVPPEGVRGADFSGPPIIIIEDSQGRVELAQVYATLNKVDRSSQAALLNYSPHSVTIGLNMLARMPEPDALVAAAEAVFGRECSIKKDGPRTTVEIGSKALR